MIETTQLDPAAKKSWLIGRGIFLAVLVILVVVAWFFMKEKLGSNIWIFYAVNGSVILLQAINTLIYPAIEYRQWRYRIDEDKVVLVHGIYFKKTSMIPIVRIQHVEIKEGPVNRFLSLANLDIKTSGGGVSVPCLHKDEASRLAQFLNERTIKKVKGTFGLETTTTGENHE